MRRFMESVLWVVLVAAVPSAAWAGESERLRAVFGEDLAGAKIVSYRGDLETVVTIDLQTCRIMSVTSLPPGPRGEEPSRPWWSADGKEVLVACGGKAFVLQADSGRVLRILPDETVYEPIFWTDPKTAERCVVYKTTQGGIPYRTGSRTDVGATYLYRPATGAKTKLADFPFDGGLSLDGTHLGEAFSSLAIKDLAADKVYVLNRGGQACHGSMSPDNTYRIMYLSQHHAYIRVCDKFDRVHWRLRIPEGSEQWQAPRWSNHPGFGAAVARFGGRYRLVVFKADTKERVVLHSLGDGWMCPHLWLPSGAAAGRRRTSPIDDLELKVLAAYKERLARVEDYSPILAELARRSEPEARAIIERLEQIGRAKLDEAAATDDPFQAKGLYVEVATRFAGLALGEEARRRLGDPPFLQRLEMAPWIERLDALMARLEHVPDSELEYAGQGFFERNRAVLVHLARLTADIQMSLPRSEVAEKARAIARKYVLHKVGGEIVSERIELLATIEATSTVPTYQQIAPYRDALTYVRYKVDRVLEGRYDGEGLIVVHWGMQSAVRTPAASWKPGLRQRLTLDHFDAHPELEGFPAGQDADDPSLVPYWAVRVENLNY